MEEVVGFGGSRTWCLRLGVKVWGGGIGFGVWEMERRKRAALGLEGKREKQKGEGEIEKKRVTVLEEVGVYGDGKEISDENLARKIWWRCMGYGLGMGEWWGRGVAVRSGGSIVVGGVAMECVGGFVLWLWRWCGYGGSEAR
ncbi:uncharacterized protein G2W53_014431 [Senna tora]|uniref:Uncharacterized protein n=1 Tax=Senna tora TaxID=362788 RepID=A0A834WTI2_9FABA|nr:uncharacterized protein G2W53_014431 [Senna tora]